MADKKISQLTGGGAAQTGDLIPVSRGTVTVSVTASAVAALAGAGSVAATAPLSVSGGTVSHNTSGVSAGTYGAAGTVPIITVNATGHVTAISGTAISGGGVGDVGARVRRGSNFSHSSSGNDIAVQFTVEEYDAGDCADLGSFSTRLTAPEAGKYAIGAHVCFAANATGVRYIFLQVNGGTRIAQESRESASGTWPTHIGINTEWELAANDYVELYAYQDSGGALDIVRASSYTPAFFMRRVA